MCYGIEFGRALRQGVEFGSGYLGVNKVWGLVSAVWDSGIAAGCETIGIWYGGKGLLLGGRFGAGLNLGLGIAVWGLIRI